MLVLFRADLNLLQFRRRRNESNRELHIRTVVDGHGCLKGLVSDKRNHEVLLSCGHTSQRECSIGTSSGAYCCLIDVDRCEWEGFTLLVCYLAGDNSGLRQYG